MRALPFAACLAASLLTVPVAVAETGPEPGPFTGAVAQGETDSHDFSTHGDQPCLAVWIPKRYVVTLAYAPPTDTLTLTAGGVTAAGSDGLATVSFVANYCTAFPVEVEGTEVASQAAYAVAVQSLLPEGPAIA